MWKHIIRLIQSIIVVDYFGIKYKGKENLEHLIATLKTMKQKLIGVVAYIVVSVLVRIVIKTMTIYPCPNM